MTVIYFFNILIIKIINHTQVILKFRKSLEPVFYNFNGIISSPALKAFLLAILKLIEYYQTRNDIDCNKSVNPS